MIKLIIQTWSNSSLFYRDRSIHQRCSRKKGVLKNFTKFTGKHVCQSLLFNKVAGENSNFIKKETLTQVLSCEFFEIFKNTCFTGHLWTTASERTKYGVLVARARLNFWTLNGFFIKGKLKFAYKKVLPWLLNSANMQRK